MSYSESDESNPSSEATAFLNWIKALGESNQDLQHKIGIESQRPVLEIDDLCDGVALLDVLATIDVQYFRSPHPPGGDKDNWVLKMGTLKRLYKLIIQYYTEVLERQTSKFPIPDLESIARVSSASDLNKLCRLVIGIIVQVPDKAPEHIAAIQTLGVEDQNILMIAMKETMELSRGLNDDEEEEDEEEENLGDDSISSRKSTKEGSGDMNDSLEVENDGENDTSYIKNLRKGSVGGDDAHSKNKFTSSNRNANGQNHHHQQEDHSSRGGNPSSNSTAESQDYEKLLEENSNLRNSLEDSNSEKKDLQSELKSLKMKVENERKNSNELNLKNEIERLKADLRRTEDGLLEAENEVERLGKLGEANNRKIEELQKKADEVSKLKDQLDEYKHTADKAQRNENVIEKYKKKLEEGADVRRQLKVLEDQNAELVDKNAALEDEYKRVAQFKPLMDSYKSQISELEGKSSNLQRDLNSSRYETEQALLRLKSTEESRAKEKEEMELYQERIKELEYGSQGINRRKKKVNENENSTDVNGAEGLVATDESFATEDSSLDDLEDGDPDLTGELDDALKGTTMTDLKIKVRKLARELEEAKVNKADVSRILVLENLLDDSQRMKTKYENDYLKEHQSKLVLASELETIRNGKSSLGDGPEAALALRRRLNETVEEIDELKKELTSLKVKNEQIEKELTIAKSDLTLVNKDQLDILQSLRSSVDVEKQGLEATVSRIREELTNSEDRNKMLMTQVNGLLMEKVDLQSEGIGHREEALKRERNLGELRASLAGKALPKEAEDLLTSLQSSNQTLEAQLKAAQDKLQKARQFIRQQDRLLKEKERQPAAEGSASGEVVKNLEQQISNLKREQALMSSAYVEQGTRLLLSLRSHSRSGSNHTNSSSSWLAQQRKSVASGLSYTSRR